MRTAVIFSDGVKQIVFTPENDDEKYALSLITADDDVEVLIKEGTFGNGMFGIEREPTTYGVEIGLCQGGWLRTWESKESRIFVIKPRKKGNTNGNA